MNYNTHTQAHWYLAFSSSDHHLMQWMKPGFQHVQAFKPMGDFWICIDPSVSHVDVQLYWRDLTIEDIVGKPCTIVRVHKSINPVQINSTLGYNTCVDTIKRLIGLKRFRIQTPYQLYRYLTNGR